jgi:DNA-binding transcriptional regulator YiaG
MIFLYTTCILIERNIDMDKAKKIKELREKTGMSRKEFCDYFDIPYRTVTEWERDTRHAPDYVVRLLEYYIRMEKLLKKDNDVKD